MSALKRAFSPYPESMPTPDGSKRIRQDAGNFNVTGSVFDGYGPRASFGVTSAASPIVGGFNQTPKPTLFDLSQPPASELIPQPNVRGPENSGIDMEINATTTFTHVVRCPISNAVVETIDDAMIVFLQKGKPVDVSSTAAWGQSRKSFEPSKYMYDAYTLAALNSLLAKMNTDDMSAREMWDTYFTLAGVVAKSNLGGYKTNTPSQIVRYGSMRDAGIVRAGPADCVNAWQNCSEPLRGFSRLGFIVKRMSRSEIAAQFEEARLHLRADDAPSETTFFRLANDQPYEKVAYNKDTMDERPFQVIPYVCNACNQPTIDDLIYERNGYGCFIELGRVMHADDLAPKPVFSQPHVDHQQLTSAAPLRIMVNVRS